MKNTTLQPHQWTNADGEVLILKCINKERKGHNGFKYPTGIGAVIEAPDFNRSPTCGGGIHGWPWGFGIGEGADYDIINGVWLVLGSPASEVVGELEKGLKCKAKAPRIRFEGNFKAAWDIVASAHTEIIRNLASASGDASNLAASGDASNLAASGDASNLVASGYASKLVASGYASKLVASGNASNLAASGNASNLAARGYASKLVASGYASKLVASGNDSKLAASGDDSKLAASGYASKLAASGDASNLAASGNDSKLAASGDASNLAASGNDSKLAASGDDSKLAASGNDSKLAASGDDSKLAASGNDSVCAVAASGGRVCVGKRGAFAIAYWTEKHGWLFITGKVGRKGVKENTWYEVRDGKLKEVK